MPKYPLKPLLELRERAVDARTTELGQAVRARESAEEARARAELVRREAEASAAQVKAREAESLGRGELRVVDLARGEAWSYAAVAHIGQLTRAVDTASAKVAGAEGAEAGARGELSRTLADRDVVEKDRARFDEQVRRRILTAEEEAAEEAFRGGRR